jgi:hypothetical protein
MPEQDNQKKTIIPSRKVLIKTDENGFIHIYTPGGEKLKHVSSIAVDFDPRRGYRPVARLEILDVDIDINATVETRTTVSYTRLDEPTFRREYEAHFLGE